MLLLIERLQREERFSPRDIASASQQFLRLLDELPPRRRHFTFIASPFGRRFLLLDDSDAVPPLLVAFHAWYRGDFRPWRQGIISFPRFSIRADAHAIAR